ncbi:MAG: LysR family transcriptional regulator [Treponema sp.]|nr:LysR family transcriptional regulator [Treponema sp.]
MDLALLRLRSAVFRGIRDFFDSRGYLEVDTPLLAADLIPESCLEVFETRLLPPRGSRKKVEDLYLIPSPELWMKRLIAGLWRGGSLGGGLSGETEEGEKKGGAPAGIYQICHCFRNGESRGRIHSPEFSMLEYYSLDADYRDSAALTEALFARLLPLALGERARDSLRPPFERIAMGDAFSRWAGFDLYKAAALPGGLEREARRLGLDPAPGLDRGTLYDLIFVDKVEPELPRDRPLILTDYPAFVPCLAKKNPGGETVERWELYSRGIELANCYSEETGAREVREFFAGEEAAKKRSALVPHRVDRDYWKIFLPESGPRGGGRSFPPCSGTALGLDRLIMILAGRSSIDEALPFPLGAEEG